MRDPKPLKFTDAEVRRARFLLFGPGRLPQRRVKLPAEPTDWGLTIRLSEGQLTVEDRAAIAKQLGVKLVTVDDGRARPDAAPAPEEKNRERTPEEWQAISEHELLKTNAKILGLKLYPCP